MWNTAVVKESEAFCGKKASVAAALEAQVKFRQVLDTCASQTAVPMPDQQVNH